MKAGSTEVRPCVSEVRGLDRDKQPQRAWNGVPPAKNENATAGPSSGAADSG
jgi:hypothetical protein